MSARIIIILNYRVLKDFERINVNKKQASDIKNAKFDILFYENISKHCFVVLTCILLCTCIRPLTSVKYVRDLTLKECGTVVMRVPEC